MEYSFRYTVLDTTLKEIKPLPLSSAKVKETLASRDKSALVLLMILNLNFF